MEVARLVLAMVLGIVLPLVAQYVDRSRMDPASRARGWNGATWGAALYAFGPLSMLGWCWVTRAPYRRVWVGALSTAGLVSLVELADVGFGLALGRAVASPAEVATVFGATAIAGAVLLGLFELVVAARRRMN
ncbi:MAG: transcriptional regulator [Deltaproteobacteria bacterium]|nr:transcriptional regulator [Deltaproteobacteria bacterium]